MKHRCLFLFFLVCSLGFQVVPGMAMDAHGQTLSLRHTQKLAAPPAPPSPGAGVRKAPDPRRQSAKETQAYRAATFWISYLPMRLIVEKDYRRFLPPVVPLPEEQPVVQESPPPAPTPDTAPQEPVPPAPTPDTAPQEPVPHPSPLLPWIVGGILALLWTLGMIYGLYGLLRHPSKKPTLPRDADHDLSHLPTSPLPLVGRRPLLRQLHAWLADPDVAVVACIAPTGTGKSALVEGWLHTLQPRYRGAAKVFGWSFHNQGDPGTQSHSGLFFSKALPFFGHEGALPATEEKRAIRLGECLQQQPSLLILDGVEPLHYPLTAPFARQEGRFSDPGLYRLLRFMRTQGAAKTHKNSLILITSRQPLRELRESPLTAQATPAEGEAAMTDLPLCAGYREMVLENLTEQEGVRLLKKLGVRKKAFHKPRSAVKMLHGHPLGLLLLGRLLARRQHASRAMPIELATLLVPGASGEHVQRILDHYDEKVWPKETPHGLFLRLFGLFDRPMTEADLQILLADATLAQPLKAMPHEAFMAMLDALEDSGLVRPALPNRCWQGHAVVQAYFRKKAEEEHAIASVVQSLQQAGDPSPPTEKPPPAQPNGLFQAHQVLSDHFQIMAPQREPDTLDTLDTLYRAIGHGCRAGAYKETLYTVFVDRIHRGAQRFSLANLGAYGSDLTALAGFFPNGWEAPPVEADLAEGDRAWLLAETTFCLTAMGRISEARKPQEEGLRMEAKRGSWQGAPRAAATLCELQMATGRLHEAKTTAEHGKQWAERGAIPTLQCQLEAQRAMALHRLGAWSESHAAFQAAEAIQAEQTPDHPHLQGLESKEYVDLLLEQQLAPLKEILHRAEQALQQATHTQKKRPMALSLLSRGRVLTATKQHEPAQASLDEAVAILEEMENAPFLAEALLQRATFMRRQREWEAAQRDLEAGLELVGRCGLVLLEVDGKLLAGHMLLDKDQREEAEKTLAHVEARITDLSYGQRRTAALNLRARLS